MSSRVTRDHHTWTRDTIKNVSGDVTLDLAGDLTLDATGDVNIPANIGLTFGDDGEKIEGDGTDLTIASSGDISITPGGGDVVISSTTSADPYFRLQNNNADANGSTLNFYKSTVTSADDDTIGEITFIQNDDDVLSPTYHTFGSIIVQTADVTDGSCGGRMELKVASHNGTATTGLKLEDGSVSGELDVNIGAGAASVTTIAGELSVTGALSSTGGSHTFTSALGNAPNVILENTRDDSGPALLTFFKNRANPADDDYCGAILFRADDDGNSATTFGDIFCSAETVADGEEGGNMEFRVASHDGEINTGLKLTDGSEEDEVDVTIGSGTSSRTTIAGDLYISGDSIVTGAITLDSSADITLDAAGEQIYFTNDGTNFGSIDMATGSRLKLIGNTNYDVILTSLGSGDVKMDSAVDIELDAGNDILIDAADALIFDSDGRYIMKQDATEFSVASSAYAGMILGYRMIGEDAIHATYTTTTSMAVPSSALTVRFIAPPSGAVEVMIQVYVNSAAGRYITFGLSDNAIYNSLGNSYEHSVNVSDETDEHTTQHYWVVTGLTAGDTYNYWFGVKGNAGANYIAWGGTSAGRWGDFIMKATALPTAVSDFAVYD